MSALRLHIWHKMTINVHMSANSSIMSAVLLVTKIRPLEKDLLDMLKL